MEKYNTFENSVYKEINKIILLDDGQSGIIDKIREIRTDVEKIAKPDY